MMASAPPIVKIAQFANTKPDSCTGCSLEKIGRGFTDVEVGKRFGQTRLLLVGEASGDSESRDGLPFRPYGQSGSLLADAMREMNISREEVAITNVIRCRPVNDALEGQWYQYSATNHCITNHLIGVIKELRPNVILALGGTAFRALTTPIKGKSGQLDYIRGFVLPGAGSAEGIPVIPTYHPAFIRRGSAHLTPLLQRDLRRAFLIATKRLTEGVHFIIDPLAHKSRYQTAPSVSEAWEWFRAIDPTRSIYADIETPRSRREDEDERNSFADRDINLIQFTQRRGEGIALPWRDDYVEVARATLATGNRKVGHNWFGFDLPVLAANGVIVNGIQDDTMILWKHFQADLPANLQTVAQYCGFPFAWKHLAESEPEFYGAIDVDATCWADETLTALLNREERMESYQRYFQRFWTVLRDMSNRGIPIDDEKRLLLDSEIEEGKLVTDAEIKKLVPEEVLSGKQKLGYKNPPLLTCETCGTKTRADHVCFVGGYVEEGDGGSVEVEKQEFTMSYAALAEEHGLVLREVTIKEEEKCRCTKKTRSGCDVCAGAGIIPAGLVEQRWMALTEFNPNSSHQVKRFMRFMKHPIPKHAKRTDANGDAAETTEVKELERLFAKTKHPIYPLLIQKRQLSKTQGTYVDGWAPGKDGRIHSTFGYGPATWQLNSRAPNAQNGMSRGKSDFQKKLVKRFKQMNAAEPGHKLLKFDFKSFHGQTTACEAEMADYLRLAKIDLHSFTGCHFIKHPERHNLLKMSDADLMAFFGELKADKKTLYNGFTFKEVRDNKTKSAGLGIGFGMRGPKLYKMYTEDFESEKEAVAVWNLIMHELFPGLYKWQEKVKQTAHEQRFLISRFGAKRYFYDVLHWDRKGQKWASGDDGEAAIAFLPASNAFGMIRDAMIELDEGGYLEKFQLCNNCHDDLRFHCPVEFVEEALEVVPREMERANPRMIYKVAPLGLSVEAEASMGTSLADMQEIKL